jgi:glucose-1-phosphate thymidylyltransferase
VATFTEHNGTTLITSIEEKPLQPKTSYAVTGCYIYDHHCFDVIRTLTPSARGEIEISDLNQWYVEQKQAHGTILQNEWIDAGTFESLFKAAEMVREGKASGN